MILLLQNDNCCNLAHTTIAADRNFHGGGGEMRKSGICDIQYLMTQVGRS